jgi:2-(1,2-epoxy-1,2-dihydrophenyl)acetyl-CoA isomerase
VTDTPKSVDTETPTGTDILTDRVRNTLMVTLNRPDHANSVHGTLFRDVVHAFEAADADEEVRAIATIGAGPTFCVGADRDVFASLGQTGGIDLHELGFQGKVGGDWGLPPQSRDQRRADTLGVGRWVHRMMDVGTPSIAGINGGAAGGGLALALMHDFRIASSEAKLVPAFIALGVSPELGLSYILPRLVGYSKALELMTRVAPIEADEALALGLVNQVVESSELRDAVLARADELAKFPPVAVSMVKRLLRQSLESSLDVQLEREWHNQTRLFGFSDTGPRVRAYLDRI